ncbi:MAG: Glycosidase-related protein, partial [Armatimonadetes bacterium CSP1-3]
KIGGGPAPVLTPHGWLLVYHGVRGRIVEGVDHQPHVHYSAGVMVLDRWDPRMVRYRSRSPVLQPESDDERYGIVPNVVFPTGLDPRGDGRIDVYYGMADFAIGVAQMAVPEQLPGV